MNVTCPSCETVYRVDPSRVPPGGVRARCAVCSNVFAVNSSSAAAQRAPVAETGPPHVAAAQRAPAAPAGPIAAPQPPAPPPAPAPPAPAPAPPRAPAMPRFSGPIAAPTSAPAPPAAPARPAPPPAPRAVPAPAAPPTAPAMRPAPPSAAPAPRAAPPPRAPAAPGAAPGQRSRPLRPVNPFMVQDPKQKARRLARALVSDLVVYHPEKRQQGLRDGTLPQLFKDELEKSWQEYVEQVGGDMAKSTPFWTEALNEILAGGNKVF